VLVDRVEAIHLLFKRNFTRVSGVYIGKTLNIRVRFNSHMKQKRKPNEMLTMIALVLFTEEDVPREDRQRWKMNPDVLSLHYERLLTEAIVEHGIETYGETQEAGGGGRATSGVSKQAALYMLLSVSNEA
jgi:hypothetical protein